MTLHFALTKATSEIGDLNIHPREDRASRSALQQLFFDKPWVIKDIMQIFQGLINENWGFKPDFLESYTEFHSKWESGFAPRITRDDGREYLEIDICWRDWHKSDKGEFIAAFDHLFAPVNDENHYDLRRFPTRKFPVRAELASLKRWLRSTVYYRVLYELGPCRRLTGEDELTMLLRGPKEEDYYVGCYEWPQVVLDELKVDGMTRRVNIA